MSNNPDIAAKLRELIAAARAPSEANPKRLSRRKLLLLVRQGEDGLLSDEKALGRFENEGKPLPPRLTTAFAQHFRLSLSETDILDAFFSGKHVTECQRHVNEAKAFYRLNEDSISETAREMAGRYFVHKLPCNPIMAGRILRSYARIKLVGDGCLMTAEYQRGVVAPQSANPQIDQEFYTGICFRKDGVREWISKEIKDGTPKSCYFDRLIIRGGITLMAFGHCTENCGIHCPNHMARSPIALERIPDSFSASQIESMIGFVNSEDIDEVFAKHVLANRYPNMDFQPEVWPNRRNGRLRTSKAKPLSQGDHPLPPALPYSHFSVDLCNEWGFGECRMIRSLSDDGVGSGQFWRPAAATGGHVFADAAR